METPAEASSSPISRSRGVPAVWRGILFARDSIQEYKDTDLNGFVEVEDSGGYTVRVLVPPRARQID